MARKRWRARSGASAGRDLVADRPPMNPSLKPERQGGYRLDLRIPGLLFMGACGAWLIWSGAKTGDLIVVAVGLGLGFGVFMLFKRTSIYKRSQGKKLQAGAVVAIAGITLIARNVLPEDGLTLVFAFVVGFALGGLLFSQVQDTE